MSNDNKAVEHLPEYSSVEAFLQFCTDDEKNTFTAKEAQLIAAACRCSQSEVTKRLKAAGLNQKTFGNQNNIRGISSNPHGTSRWTGEGNTFTTPGTDSIVGFAGREGN